MNKKINLREKALLCIAFFSVCGLLVSCDTQDMNLISLDDETGLETVSLEESSSDSSNDYSDNDNIIFVYVTGQVKNPGVYQLQNNARLYEAVEKAGGFTKKAAKSSMNLAEKVVDGQHIDVLSKKELSGIKQSDEKRQSKENQQSDANQQINNSQQESLININTATVEELMQLPGIGESKANAIISYRNESGGFDSIESIMQVPGIKEGAYSKIKSLIRV